MKSTKHKLIILIVILFISGCEIGSSKKDLKEDTFKALYPNCTMNSTIQFLPPQENFKFDSYIHLSYKNYSQDQVIFPPDSNIKILRYEISNSQWTELKNDMQYASSPEPYIILDPSDGLTSYSTIVFYPSAIPNPPRELRIVIHGFKYIDNTESNECVGSYIDIRI